MQSATKLVRWNENLAQLSSRFNREPFLFGHSLASHDAFALPRLLDLAKRSRHRMVRKGLAGVSFDAGSYAIEERPTSGINATIASLDEAIDNFDNAQAWIIIRDPHTFPEYRDIFNSCLDEFKEVIPAPLQRRLGVLQTYFILSSPNRITQYHIDPEVNFLLHLHGSKELSVFNPNDRSVLSDEEIKKRFSGDRDAAVFRKDSAAKARVFRLSPGTGINIPLVAPHWARTFSEPCVSAGMTFDLANTVIGDVYKLNYYMSKAGLTPKRPGESRWRDNLKIAALTSARKITRLRRLFSPA